ncbi:MAG: histidine phosphotransferase family protein [Rhodobacteraceae bacterium]|nr:histidine phosphotransferase family protein [Paracoccaceae bacterium]
MGDNSVNLASLIGSRICHDLISPIGAISNGLELLDLTGGVEGPEMELISDSVGNAGARIQFFRIAYGAVGPQMMGHTEVSGLLNDLNQGGRILVQWTPREAQSRAEVRLAFLALQCLETAMPYGGVIEICSSGGHWSATGTADKLNVDEKLWKMAGGVEITPSLVQFALLPVAAADLGRKVTMDHDTGTITLRF